MSITVAGGVTGSKQEVDTTPLAARTIIYDSDGDPLALEDHAVVPATPHGLPLVVYNEGIARVVRGSSLGGVALARYAMLFEDMVDGAAVNTQLWTQSAATMTITQATRNAILNANNTVTTTTNAIHTSLRQFSRPRNAALRFSARVRFSWQAAGAVIECGFGNPATTTVAIPNGVFLRVGNNGDVKAGFAYNSAETVTATLATIGTGAGQINPAHYYDVEIMLLESNMRVQVSRSDDSLGGAAEACVIDTILHFAVATIAEFNLVSIPAFFRIYNNTAPSTASQLIYSSVNVTSHDVDMQKPWSEQLAGMGRGFITNPASGVQLANYANSAAPASATLSNTAAGYTTLGGQWQFAAVAGAETDFALFGFAVPTGRTLHVRGVRIDAWNTVVAVATTGTVLQWGVGRANAVTLASSSFRAAIGAQAFLVAAAVGAMAPTLDWNPAVPFVVDSGQTFHVILKVPIGTATATEIFRGVCVVNAYLE